MGFRVSGLSRTGRLLWAREMAQDPGVRDRAKHPVVCHRRNPRTQGWYPGLARFSKYTLRTRNLLFLVGCFYRKATYKRKVTVGWDSCQVDSRAEDLKLQSLGRGGASFWGAWLWQRAWGLVWGVGVRVYGLGFGNLVTSNLVLCKPPTPNQHPPPPRPKAGNQGKATVTSRVHYKKRTHIYSKLLLPRLIRQRSDSSMWLRLVRTNSPARRAWSKGSSTVVGSSIEVKVTWVDVSSALYGVFATFTRVC